MEVKEMLPSNANGMIVMRKVDEEAEEVSSSLTPPTPDLSR
jgi:hypothetical protein